MALDGRMPAETVSCSDENSEVTVAGVEEAAAEVMSLWWAMTVREEEADGDDDKWVGLVPWNI